MDNHFQEQNGLPSQTSSPSPVRKPSFRSEIKIHITDSNADRSRARSKPPLNIQKTSTNKKWLPGDEARVDRQGTIHLKFSSADNQLIKLNSTSSGHHDDNHKQPINNSFTSKNSPPLSGRYPAKNILFHDKTSPRLLKSPLSQGQIEFNRSSSVHSGSFLYPSKKSEPVVRDVSPPEIKIDPDRKITNKPESFLTKSTEKTKSSDNLFEEAVLRKESFKNCEKRHSVCAMETENGKEREIAKLKNNNLDTISLKPGPSTLSLSMPNWFVRKYVERQESKLGKATRKKSVSCRDLGGVDCEGWLWKMQEKSGRKKNKWILWWCILENKKLIFYKERESKSAEGSIHLPGLRIAPAAELKNKKFAFKAFHSGCTFYFCSERRDEMVKWMNKMGLATLSDFEVESSKVIAGFQNLDEDNEFSSQRSYCSESDDSASYKDSDCGSSDCGIATSREDLRNLNRISKSSDNLQSPRNSNQLLQYQIRYKLSTLTRQLRDKEKELLIIGQLLENQPITSEHLRTYMDQWDENQSETAVTTIVVDVEDTNQTEAVSKGDENISVQNGTQRETFEQPQGENLLEPSNLE